MDKYSQKDYYRIVDALRSDPKYLDAVADELMGLPIELVGWEDRVTENKNTRKEIIVGKDDGHDVVRLERFDGEVHKEGTPVDSLHLGRMEWNDLINFVKAKYLMDAVRRLELELEAVKTSLANKMAHKTFTADMQNIDKDMILLAGYYDEKNERGVI